ncbi:Mus7/MMS22 family-domain-containing protein [Protomyces lactucae-debilis]|uniref:Mus7/MMS22 family-domain-containing protein n=1 Tax=Protomyces lactucae-debilis TaxID=2754530 RepID=A0A1Y2F2W7_PROLT|nr:Mus7/MMS22 family-domain-containing protein [Protomyces lactucae-debilis]ORY78221.1 Mus7/MMS22 family-domain-containing protein [Protomyces lactucae-debilis]
MDEVPDSEDELWQPPRTAIIATKRTTASNDLIIDEAPALSLASAVYDHERSLSPDELASASSVPCMTDQQAQPVETQPPPAGQQIPFPLSLLADSDDSLSDVPTADVGDGAMDDLVVKPSVTRTPTQTLVFSSQANSPIPEPAVHSTVMIQSSQTRESPQQPSSPSAIEPAMTPSRIANERRFRPRKAAQLKPFSYDMAQHAREFQAAGFKPMRFRGLPEPLLLPGNVLGPEADAEFLPPVRLARKPSRSRSPPSGILSRPNAVDNVPAKQLKRRIKRWREINRFDNLLQPDKPLRSTEPLLALENWNAASPEASDLEEADAQEEAEFALNVTPGLSPLHMPSQRRSPTPLSSSEEDTTAATAHLVKQIRKKTRGVLPASFKFFAETPAAALNRLARPNNIDASGIKVRGKAVRKDKTGQVLPHRSAWQIEAFSSASEEEATMPTVPRGSVRSSVGGVHALSTPQLQSTASGPIFIDDDSDMEQEEQIDRMVDRATPRPRVSRIGPGQAKRKRQQKLPDGFAKPRQSSSAKPPSRHDRAKQTRRRRAAPPLFIGDLLDQFENRSQAPRDVRLASRAVRQRGGDAGTQLSRKQFSFYDPTVRSEPDATDAEEGIQRVFRRWAKGVLPVEGQRAKQHQQRQVLKQQRLALQPSEPKQVRKRKKASTVRSGGFYLDEAEEATDEEGLPLSLHQQRPPAVPKQQKKAKQVRFFASRTFQTTLEKETGQIAIAPHTTAPQRTAKRPAYLRNLVEITNLFEEDDFAAKVSLWQAQAPTQQHDESIRPDDANLAAPHRKQKLQRKNAAQRKVPLQQSLVPFLIEADEGRTEANVSTMFVSDAILTDVSLGCEPLSPGCFFAQDTVAGAELAAVLADGTFLSICFYEHARYDVGHLPQLINRFFPALEYAIRAGKPVQRDEYDVFRFLINDTDLQTKADIFGKTNELRQLALLSEHILSRSWLCTFCLIFSFQMAQQQNQWNQFSQVVESVLGFLLSSTLESVESMLRRQRDQMARSQGISASDGSMLECWTVLFHVTQASASADATLPSFWTRINKWLDLPRCGNHALSERAWKTIMLLSSITSFDLFGHAALPVENWDCVLALLGKVLTGYDQQSALPSSGSHDAYIYLSLRRCHRLATIFQWQNCGKLLQGKVGGVLHDFFWRQLSLANLQHEQSLYGAFPPFLHHLGDELACLEYEPGDMAGTFSTFLKLLCLCLHQLQDDLESDDRRGINQMRTIVDKFQTFGPMNAQADADLSITQLGQMRNRFAVEIAIYWAAGQYKHQDISRLLETSAAHIAGSHLELRRVNIEAWGIVVRLQLSRGEEVRLPATIAWFRRIFSTTVDDIKRFTVEMSQQQSSGRFKALQENVGRCHRIVLECISAYSAVLALPGVKASPSRVHQFWFMDIFTAILHNQAIFQCQSASSANGRLAVLQQALDLTAPLVEAAAAFGSEEESQDFGFDFSQDEDGNALVDMKTFVKQDLLETAQLVHRFLSDVFSSCWRYERDSSGEYVPKEVPITALLIQQCKMGIEALYRCVRALRKIEKAPWSSLFDRQGLLTWWKLPEAAISARVLPFYLALLLRREATFYDEMSHYVIAVWLGNMANPDVRASQATLTNELVKHNTDLVNVGEMTADLLDQYRLSYIDISLRVLIRDSNLELARNCVASLADVIKAYFQGITDEADKAFYTSFAQAIIRVIHEYCGTALALDDIPALAWLLDESNLQQPARMYAVAQLRSFAHVDIASIWGSFAVTIAEYCEEQITDPPSAALSILCQAFGTLEGRSWNHEVASLRRFIVVGIYTALSQLSNTLPQAVLYAAVLSQELQKTYEQLTAECLQADEATQLHLAHEICQLAFDLQRSSSLTTLFMRLLGHSLRTQCKEVVVEFREAIRKPQVAVQPPAAVCRALEQHLQDTWRAQDQEAVHCMLDLHVVVEQQASLFTQPESAFLEAVSHLDVA